MIESTSGHRPLVQDEDLLMFLDMDLSILAAPANLYYQYTISVREEYQQFSDSDYISGRKKVLRHFLDRPHLFYSIPFREKLEQPARRNIQEELKSMDALL